MYGIIRIICYCEHDWNCNLIRGCSKLVFKVLNIHVWDSRLIIITIWHDYSLTLTSWHWLLRCTVFHSKLNPGLSKLMLARSDFLSPECLWRSWATAEQWQQRGTPNSKQGQSSLHCALFFTILTAYVVEVRIMVILRDVEFMSKSECKPTGDLKGKKCCPLDVFDF